MINAKEEFLFLIEEAKNNNPNLRLSSAQFSFRPRGDYDEIDEYDYFYLFKNYTEDEYVEFLERLNFNYDSGYGIQMLFGNIWFEDIKTKNIVWADRGEYDGSEWWELHLCPEEPTRNTL